MSLDLDTANWRISQTLVVVDYTPTLSTPKTERGRRVVRLDGFTVAALREHRKRQVAERLAAGDAWSNELDLVFTDELGRPVHPQAFSEAFRRKAKAAGPPALKLKNLRHSHATTLLRAGTHPAIVSERLGHFSAAFTLDTYTDSVPALHSAAAESAAVPCSVCKRLATEGRTAMRGADLNTKNPPFPAGLRGCGARIRTLTT